MNNGRFGPIEPNEKQKKKYRVDYNRLITVIMILAIIILLLVIFMDAKKQPEDKSAGTIIDAQQNHFAIETPAPRATVSPEELRPVSESEDLLPVFYRANTSSMRVAVTIEKLQDADNISTLLGLLATYNAKVTFFPTGEEISRNMSAWPQVIMAGHQIENHTYSNKRLSTLMDEDKTSEVRAQTEILRSLIGSDYQPHFLRTDNLEDDTDELLHAYLKGNGYFGIARWDENNPESIHQVQSGAILNFPLTDSGLSKLSSAIPVLVNSGYELVTLNELFQYPDNIESNENTAG
ncbi:MAG: polysaccharide deacetylase family protein [Clostridia bacterium]|nr:polysaccharide deacetylase family protein [Clostridia bacterium]